MPAHFTFRLLIALAAITLSPLRADTISLRADDWETRPTYQVAEWPQGELRLSAEMFGRAEAHALKSFDPKQATIRVTLRFDKTAQTAADGAAGVRFMGADAFAVQLKPAAGTLLIGDASFPLKTLLEEDGLFEVSIALGDGEVAVDIGGARVGAAPHVFKGAQRLQLFVVGRGTVSFATLSVAAESAAHSDEPPPAVANGVTLTFDPAASRSLAGPWRDYMGNHYQALPPMTWVRGYGRPTRNAKTRDDDLSSFPTRFGRGVEAPEDFAALLDDASARGLSLVFVLSEFFPPSMDGLDAEAVRRFMRAVYRAHPEMRDRILWQPGNEVNGLHFDPLGLSRKYAKDIPELNRRRDELRNSAQQREWYLEGYFVPALSAIRSVSEEIFHDPLAIRVSSPTFANSGMMEWREWMATTLETPLVAKVAPELRGRTILDCVDMLCVHYPVGTGQDDEALDDFWKRFGRTGKIKALWVTEEYGARGKAGATILERTLPFLAWAAREQLSAEQAKIFWWGLQAVKAGGDPTAFAHEFGEFFDTRQVSITTLRTGDTRAYLLRAEPQETGSRAMVVVLPSGNGALALGDLHLPLGASSGGWQARATYLSSSRAPVETALKCEPSDDGTMSVQIRRELREPLFVCLEMRAAKP